MDDAHRERLPNSVWWILAGVCCVAAVVASSMCSEFQSAWFFSVHGDRPCVIVSQPALARPSCISCGATPRPGPLLLDEYDATTLVPPGCAARLDAHGNIVITTGGAA